MQRNPDGSEFLYNVEHIFEEDGKIVRKMPIKIGNETMWVETVNQNEMETNNDSLMLPLNDVSSVSGEVPVVQHQHQQPQQHVTAAVEEQKIEVDTSSNARASYRKTR